MDPVNWTPRERAWLDGNSHGDFRALMRHLDSNQPLPDAKRRALDEKLQSFEPEDRVTPPEWIPRLIAGEQIELLELVETLYLAGAECLARSPHLDRLMHLDVTFCGIGPEGHRALEQSDPLWPDAIRSDANDR